MGVDVFAEGGVDAALVAAAGGAKEIKNIGVEAEGDLLLAFGHLEAGFQVLPSLNGREQNRTQA